MTKQRRTLTPLEALVIVNTLPAFWWTQCMSTYVLLASPLLLLGAGGVPDGDAS